MQRQVRGLATVTGLASLLLLLLLSVGCNGGGEEATASPTVPAPSPTVSATRTTLPATRTPLPIDVTAIAVNGTSIVVDSSADTDSRDGALTLQEAIMLATGELAVADLDPREANNISGTPGPESDDTIIFHPSLFPADVPAIISLVATLPTLATGSDTVDGSGAGVIVDGGNQGFNCFHIDSDGNTIKGLQIQNCRTAILLAGDARNNTIGGPGEAHRNIIGPNDAVGIQISGSGNVVQGNYIGTDATGTESRSNRMEGIWIAPGAQDNLIGGSNAGERNVISGNNLFGISIDGPATTGNVVKGNYIGVDASGRVALQNRYGVVLWHAAQNNTIGGSAPGEANVISGNQSGGVLIRGSETNANLVIGNFIGTDLSGSETLGQGTGIWLLDGPQGNIIGGTSDGEGNVIAHSGIYGIRIEGADTTGNTIRGNSIYSNSRVGIVSKDGGNLTLASPVITASGPVKGTACPNCTVDIYSDAANEGEVYEGSTLADADGNWSFPGWPQGPNVAATATDSAGNTSEFSEPEAVPEPTPTP